VCLVHLLRSPGEVVLRSPGQVREVRLLRHDQKALGLLQLRHLHRGQPELQLLLLRHQVEWLRLLGRNHTQVMGLLLGMLHLCV
jgi:hypothetical protein